MIELLSHGRIDAKSAGVMVYALQAASINLRSPDLMERREDDGERGSLPETLLKYLKLPVPRFRQMMEESEGRKYNDDDLSFDEEDEEEIRMLLPIEDPPQLEA